MEVTHAAGRGLEGEELEAHRGDAASDPETCHHDGIAPVISTHRVSAASFLHLLAVS